MRTWAIDASPRGSPRTAALAMTSDGQRSVRATTAPVLAGEIDLWMDNALYGVRDVIQTKCCDDGFLPYAV
jgi:hypothetical protein